MHFQATRIKSLKQIFFDVWTGFDAFPSHHNQVLQKDILLRLGWLKTCFDAFPDHQKQGLKKDFFLTSGTVKNMF
jgi:hypothetical protein